MPPFDQPKLDADDTRSKVYLYHLVEYESSFKKMLITLKHPMDHKQRRRRKSEWLIHSPSSQNGLLRAVAKVNLLMCRSVFLIGYLEAGYKIKLLT